MEGQTDGCIVGGWAYLSMSLSVSVPSSKNNRLSDWKTVTYVVVLLPILYWDTLKDLTKAFIKFAVMYSRYNK